MESGSATNCDKGPCRSLGPLRPPRHPLIKGVGCRSPALAKFEKGKPVNLGALVGKKRPKPVHTRASPNRTKAPRSRSGEWSVRKRQVWHPAFTLAMRIAAAMMPGRWYAKVDVERASGVAKDSVKARVATMLADGLLERAENPDSAPWRYPKGERVDSAASKARRVPVWLYRLTAEGERFRVRAMALA